MVAPVAHSESDIAGMIERARSGNKAAFGALMER
jgi:hypothetical protein